MRRLLPLLFVLALSGCGELPQPFRHTDDNPLLAPGARAGVVVLPVAAAPQPAEMAEAVAEALRKADMLATTTGGNAGSWLVEGNAGSDGKRVLLTWRVWDPQHRLYASTSQTVSPTALSSTQGITRTAAEVAPALAALLGDHYVKKAALPQGPLVALRGVKGAPGDGNVALARAMAASLRASGYRIAAEDWQVAIDGRVKLDKGPSQDQVVIEWFVVGPDGAELGRLRQANQVPHGQLDRRWGRIAGFVAEAAAPGLTELLERAATQE